MVQATEYARSTVLSFVDSSAQIHGMRSNLIGLNNTFFSYQSYYPKKILHQTLSKGANYLIVRVHYSKCERMWQRSRHVEIVFCYLEPFCISNKTKVTGFLHLQYN